MNLAQKLKSLEEQKQALIKESEEQVKNNYFCFMKINPVQLISSKIPKGTEHFRTQISIEIIVIPPSDTNYHHLFSLEFNTTLEVDFKIKDKPLSFHSSHFSHIKSINKDGIFFIDNYQDLNPLQKFELGRKLDNYYESLQDPYDSIAIPQLRLRGFVDYQKFSNTNMTLKDFSKQVLNQIPDIVEKNLSTLVVDKIKQGFETSERLYQLTNSDKEELYKHMKKSFSKAIKDTTTHREKDNNNYGQNHWIEVHNQVCDYFNQLDSLVSNSKTSTKKTTRKLK